LYEVNKILKEITINFMMEKEVNIQSHVSEEVETEEDYGA